MQWGLNGRPNWYAPRRIALLVTPLLGGCGFLLATAVLFVAPRSDAADAAGMTPLLAVLALLGLAVFAGYLWLVRGWDRAGGL